MNTAIGLMFSGQGSQQVGMMQSLYNDLPVCRTLIEQAEAILGMDFIKVCFEGPEERLTQTVYCQPALYVHGYSIYKALQSQEKLNNLKAVLGLSLGELTALAVANVYDFETGLKMVAKRGEYMQTACENTQGSMASLLGGDIHSIRELCQEFDIDIANINCPGQIVISGHTHNIQQAIEKAKALGTFKRVLPLNVAGAYHSRLMQSASQAFKAYIEPITFHPPTLTVFTNTTGQAIQDPNSIKHALTEQIVSTVLFEDCIRNAKNIGLDTLYECGPGTVLAGLTKRTIENTPTYSLSQAEHINAL